MKSGFTLLELIVVIVIIVILSLTFTTIVSNYVERARISLAQSEIRDLEQALMQYRLDLDSYPPSGSSLFGTAQGASYLYVTLSYSMSLSASSPASENWNGPYLDFKRTRLGNTEGIPLNHLETAQLPQPLQTQILDPWGTPYLYIHNGEYIRGGTRHPSGDPLANVETYFNSKTFQLISYGPNRITETGNDSRGLDEDDITNF